MDSSYCVDQLVELILMPDTGSSPEQHLDRVRSLLEEITSDKIDSARKSSPPNLLYSISGISPLESLLSLPTSLTTSPTTLETLQLLLSKGSDPLAANQSIFDAYFEKAKNSEADVHECFVRLTGLILERIREAREGQEEIVVLKTEETLPLPPKSRASPSRARQESSHHGSVDVPKPSSRSTSDSDKAQPQRPRIRLYITLPPCTSPASLVDYFYQVLKLEINIAHVQMSTSPPCFAFVDVDEQLWLEGEILKRVEWGRVSKPFLGGAGRSWALVLRLAIPRRYERAVANVVPSLVQQAQSSTPSVQAPLSRLPPLPPPPPPRLPPSPLALSSPDYNPPGTTSVISPVHTPISNPVPNAPSYSPHPGFHSPAYCLTPDGPSSSYSPFSPSPSLAHLDSPRSASPLPADSPTCPSLSLVIPDPALPHTPPQTLPLPARKEEPSETLVPEKTHDRDGWIRLTLEGLPFDSTTHSSVETLLSRFLKFWKDLEIVRDDRRYRLQALFSVKGEKTVQSLEKQVATWVLAGQKLLVTRVKIKESIEIKDEVFDSKLEPWEEPARGMMGIEEEQVGPKLEVKEEPDESNVGLFESQVRDELVGLESQREDGECSMEMSETTSDADASELKNPGRSPSDEIERDVERNSRKRRTRRGRKSRSTWTTMSNKRPRYEEVGEASSRDDRRRSCSPQRSCPPQHSPYDEDHSTRRPSTSSETRYGFPSTGWRSPSHPETRPERQPSQPSMPRSTDPRRRTLKYSESPPRYPLSSSRRDDHDDRSPYTSSQRPARIPPLSRRGPPPHYDPETQTSTSLYPPRPESRRHLQGEWSQTRMFREQKKYRDAEQLLADRDRERERGQGQSYPEDFGWERPGGDGEEWRRDGG